MRTFEAPEIVIMALQPQDVIATLSNLEDHDNGFVDIGDL